MSFFRTFFNKTPVKVRKLKSWHFVMECYKGHPIAKTKNKRRSGDIATAENSIRLKKYKGKFKNGEMIGCKCGVGAGGTSRKITDKT